MGEVLRQNGYATAWIGKNHNTPAWETSAAGPFDRWANGLGFDYFYGFNAGDMNHWDPILFENRNLVPKNTARDYHLTEDLADKAIAWTRQVTSIAPDKPFFLYVAPAQIIRRTTLPGNGSTGSKASSTPAGMNTGK